MKKSVLASVLHNND